MLVKSGSGTLVCLVGSLASSCPAPLAYKVTDLLPQWKYEVAKVAKNKKSRLSSVVGWTAKMPDTHLCKNDGVHGRSQRLCLIFCFCCVDLD